MNPNPFVMAALADDHRRTKRIEEQRQAALHAKAVARRRKSKRGGPR